MAVRLERGLVWRGVLLFVVGVSVLGDLLMSLDVGAKHAFLSDFTVFWTASRVDSSILYNASGFTHAQGGLVAVGAGVRPFAYPPSLLLWIKPFGLIEYWPSAILWSALGLAAYTFAARRIASLPALLFSFMSPMLFLTVIAGQATLFIAALIIAGLSFSKTRPVLGGVLLGLAATLKPQAVALAPLALVAGRNWKTLISAVTTGAGIGMACLVLQGPPLWRGWFDAAVRFLSTVKEVGYVDIGVTPSAIVARLNLTGLPALVLLVLGATLGLACVWTVFRTTDQPAPRTAALVTGCLLCAPYALDYELTSLAPSAALMILDPKRPRVTWIAAALAFTAGAGPISVALFAFALILEHGLWRSTTGPDQRQRSRRIASLPLRATNS